MVTFLGSLVESCCWEGGALQTNVTGVCGERSQCLGHTGFAPAHGVCAFIVYTAQALGWSAGNCLEAGPGLRAFPRSKPLRFRFSSTPQRCRFGWACVLCPSQVRAAQVLGECSRPQFGTASYCLPHPSHSVFWVYNWHAFSGLLCVPSGELISGWDPPSRCRSSRIPRREACLQFGT